MIVIIIFDENFKRERYSRVANVRDITLNMPWCELFVTRGHTQYVITIQNEVSFSTHLKMWWRNEITYLNFWVIVWIKITNLCRFIIQYYHRKVSFFVDLSFHISEQNTRDINRKIIVSNGINVMSSLAEINLNFIKIQLIKQAGKEDCWQVNWLFLASRFFFILFVLNDPFCSCQFTQ